MISKDPTYPMIMAWGMLPLYFLLMLRPSATWVLQNRRVVGTRPGEFRVFFRTPKLYAIFLTIRHVTTNKITGQDWSANV